MYAYDDEPAKQAAARSLLEREPVTISTQVLEEFYWVTTRRLQHPLEPAIARAAVQRLTGFPVLVTRPEHVLAAADVATEQQLAFWDALIVVAAAAAGCDVLLTEGLRAGAEILGVRIPNPFADAA